MGTSDMALNTANQAALAFQTILHGLFKNGAGRSEPWTAQDLVIAMEKAGCTTSPDIVADWFAVTANGRPVPSPTKFTCLKALLFPGCAGHEALDEAWRKVRALDRPKRSAASSIAAGAVAPVWVAEPVVQVEGLVDLIVNQPVLNNDPDEPNLRLPGTIVIDGGFTQPHQGRTVHIGVEEVVLSLEAPGNAPLPNKRFRHAFDNLGGKPASGGVRVREPRDPGGWMDGELVGDGTIAFLEASGGAEKPITVRVLVKADHVVVHDVTDGKNPRQKVFGDRKQAVVGEIIRLGREVDGQDRVSIGRARLVRRKEG